MALLHLTNLKEDATKLRRQATTSMKKRLKVYQYAADGIIYTLKGDDKHLYFILTFEDEGQDIYRIGASKVPVT